MYENFFKNKELNIKKLLEFGFEYKENKKIYIYKVDIFERKMAIEISIKDLIIPRVNIRVIDNITKDEYVLYKILSVSGSYVEKVRTEIENILEKISKECFGISENSNQIKNKILEYVKNKYNSEQEFLWKKGENSIIRRNDNKKWYGVFIKVKKEKIGIECKEDEEETIEILNLRLTKAEIEELLNKKDYFPAYHMNKENWISLSLEGNLELKEIFEKIDKSYELVATKKGQKKKS